MQNKHQEYKEIQIVIKDVSKMHIRFTTQLIDTPLLLAYLPVFENIKVGV
jgi:hypothetical protein